MLKGKGFSIIEAIVALSVSSIAALALFKLSANATHNLSKTQKKLNNHLLEYNMANPSGCSTSSIRSSQPIFKCRMNRKRNSPTILLVK